MQKSTILAISVVLCVAEVNGDRVIGQYNASVPETAYEIQPVTGRIFIKEACEYTFMFEAYDDQTNQPADIELIQIDAGVAGLVKISVIGDDSYDRVYGAREVKEIQMQTDGSDAWLAEILIAEDLGRNGPIVANHLGIQGGWGIFNVGSLKETIVCEC